MKPEASKPAVGDVGPLAGLRVLELGSLIAAPFATRLMADLGADVIKIEAPDKLDGLRQWGAAKDRGRSLWWPLQTRSKRLITLNLRVVEGQRLCRELAARSDVLVENFRPGTMERWGLGPDELHSVNPALIYTRISGYGQTGRYADRPGFASTGEAMGGLRHLNGFPGGPPPRSGLSLGDSLCAMFAVIGTLAALRNREVGDGLGQVVDASIVESCFALLESVAPEYQRLGLVRGPTGTTIANNAPSNIYRSADDRWIVIAANAQNLWPRLCRAIDREDLVQEPRFATHDARGEHMAELDAIIGEWARVRSAAEIDTQMNAAGVVCGPVYSIEDIFSDPYFKEREMLVAVDDEELGEVLAPGVVPKLSRTPGRGEFRATWAAGQHNAEVFGELLELGSQELQDLADAGVI